MAFRRVATHKFRKSNDHERGGQKVLMAESVATHNFRKSNVHEQGGKKVLMAESLAVAGGEIGDDAYESVGLTPVELALAVV